ncbi:TPA: hypothetical protein ACNMR4_005806 [Klebsiella pneumoniae]|nr:hypothetical protein [Klebsiella pneumoniae]
MNMMISYQELVRTFPSAGDNKKQHNNGVMDNFICSPFAKVEMLSVVAIY